MNVLTIASLATIAFVLTLLIANILRHRHLFRDHFRRKVSKEAPIVQEELFEDIADEEQK